MTGFFRAQNVVDIENVVTVLVVETIILQALAWLRENSPWITGRFVFEMWIADAVGGREMDGQCLQRLNKNQLAPNVHIRSENDGRERTLINPPSGFARRNGGCELTTGRSSPWFWRLLNSGTGFGVGLPPGLLLPLLLLPKLVTGSCGRRGDLWSPYNVSIGDSPPDAGE